MPEPRYAPTRIWLLAAPIVAVVGRVLWIPIDDQDSAGYLATVGDHPDRAAAGALLVVLSALLLVPAAFGASLRLRGATPRASRWVTPMIAVGATGMGSIAAIAVTAPVLADQPDRAAMVATWDQLLDDSWGSVFYLAILVGMIGFFVLGWGLWRSASVPKPAAVAVGLGGAAMLFSVGGPVKAIVLGSAVVLLAGLGWLAATPEPAEVGADTRVPAPAA